MLPRDGPPWPGSDFSSTVAPWGDLHSPTEGVATVPVPLSILDLAIIGKGESAAHQPRGKRGTGP